jgi:uncharacterized protein YjgD (DUF1641 family)
MRDRTEVLTVSTHAVNQEVSDGDNGLDDLLEVMSQAHVQESLAHMLDRLPQLVQHLDAMERMASFASAVMSDRQSLEYLYTGIRDDLPPVTLNKDTLAAALVLLDKLPKLVESLAVLDRGLDFVRALAADKASLEYLFQGAAGWVEPLQSRVQAGVDVVRAAEERSRNDTSPVSIFTVLRLLKDPVVQRGVHFAQALLVELAQRKAAPGNTANKG